MAFPLIHHLFHSWSGWPAGRVFPPKPSDVFFEALAAAWKTDGLELQSSAWTPTQIQLTLKTAPGVAPVFLAARVKGRLQHALQRAGTPCRFSRKIAVRSLGDNRSPEVGTYLHVHVAVRGDAERSPLALAEALWGSLHCAVGCGLMGENLYAGTFSEYGLGAIKKWT